MKKSIFALSVGLMLLASPVLASYTSITGNLVDGVVDTGFDAGKLWIEQDSNSITLNDDSNPLTGTITNGHLSVYTYLHSCEGQVAEFWGGQFSLTFTYDGLAKEISGPISAMQFAVTMTSENFSMISGEGLWKALTVNLPGSNDWPDSGGLSGIDTLTLAFNQDLTDWCWGDPLAAAETIWGIIPSDSPVPEPMTVVLLALSSLGLLRRRRA